MNYKLTKIQEKRLADELDRIIPGDEYETDNALYFEVFSAMKKLMENELGEQKRKLDAN